jgi:hypothetical protein
MTTPGDNHDTPTRAAVRIEVLHVPGCSRLDGVRALIDRALTATGINGTIEEVVGDYASPTVLVNGIDVTGRSAKSGAACRLDLPTDAQLGDMLTGTR